MKALVGISCCIKPVGVFATPSHAASDTYVRAIGDAVGATPVLLPADVAACDLELILSRIDGLLLTGSRSNVQPCLYGGPAHAPDIPEDPARDAVTLPLLRAAIGRGLPVLAICRGLQEMNVAFGGTLHQRLQDLPGRLDHSTPLQANPRVRTGKAHRIDIVPDSWLHRTVGTRSVAVNSLHNQGVDRLASGLVAEAHAPDGTIEAVRVTDAAGFAVGVQWHPEFDWQTDAASRAIFTAFANAVAAYATPTGQALAAD